MILRPSRLLMLVRRVFGNDQLVLGVLSLVVGAAVGGAIVGFRELIGLIQLQFYGTASERLASQAVTLPWWQLLLAPIAGGLLVGAYYRWVMPGGKPQGVPHVIEASAMKGGRMGWWAGLTAAVGAALSIGTGGSVGREGPAVHIGGTLGGWLAGQLHLSRPLSRSLLGCGVAAAVSASFNAPIAGALFAHEVVLGTYTVSAFAPIVIASVAGTVVARIWYGNFPAFILPSYEMNSALEFPAFAGLGVVCGIMAMLFMQSVLAAEARFGRLKLPDWLRPAAGGVMLGVLAMLFPQVLGVGYEVTDDALRGLLPLGLLLLLFLAKWAATVACVGSGWGGGVFSPSLALGALLGGIYGQLTTLLVPGFSSGPGAYAVVGMGAMAAAVLGAPISTVLIIFELTGDYELTVAVMVAVVIATVLTQQIVGKPSFFHWQLERRGLNLSAGQEVGLLRSLQVKDVMQPEVTTVSPSTSLPAVREALQHVAYGKLFVVDVDGRLTGTISLPDLSEAAFETAYDPLLCAADVAKAHPPVLQLTDNLAHAMKVMLSSAEEHVAVVADKEGMRLVGCVHEAEALLTYNRALIHSRAEETGGKGAMPF